MKYFLGVVSVEEILSLLPLSVRLLKMEHATTMEDLHIAPHCDNVFGHLQEVSAICGRLTGKLGLPEAGHLLGLLHDFGKYSNEFQGNMPSSDNDAQELKDRIDHSTAGAQWVWQHFSEYGPQGELVAQILSVCLVSHHGGLLDCLSKDGSNGLQKRINRDDTDMLQECFQVADEKVLKELRKFDNLVTTSFLVDFFNIIIKIVAPEKKISQAIQQFYLGMFTRFLFSCLIDANSTSCSNPTRAFLPYSTGRIDWRVAIERMESKYASFPLRNHIDIVRRDISEQCCKRAKEEQGIYTLTVPTGGGKTFSSIRYALHHAHKHQLDHIIYILPFTSIIEQNANEIRKVLEREGDTFPWVLEHHSNLEPEKQNWRAKMITEDWDTPVIFTTMAQFLEVLFAGGTRGARRMHTLAKSVLIFDEIQSLPVNCVHLFCNAVQFLVDHAGTSAVLCTTTQTLLNDLKNTDLSQLLVQENHELVDNTAAVFAQLNRVEIKNMVRVAGWTEKEIAAFTLNQLEKKGNCLVVVNTNNWAKKLYTRCKAEVEEEVIIYLSTSLCPAHRKKILAKMGHRLKVGLPLLCISTQLIEAGVDIDFNVVIRFLAGLDSIAQAAGRCNRNGILATADVFVLNPQEELIDRLEDIKIGRDKALRIFSEEKEAELLKEEVMERYFSYYFYGRSEVMAYPLSEEQVGRNDTLLSLLSDNYLNIGPTEPLQMRQAFKTAGQAFKAIDAPTQAVIVPYEDGEKVIALLRAEFNPSNVYDLLKQAQQYSVNVFPHIWQKLREVGAVHPVQEGEEIYYLDVLYYDKQFGLSVEVVSLMDTFTGGSPLTLSVS
ncbi:MAG: CRISPR-associated helicase Cas3' [Candidatus Electrothrix sp. AR3]|nr:CRISPR-associated helicase Cas3' [Candidatus Electrothrix sp. AR3]